MDSNVQELSDFEFKTFIEKPLVCIDFFAESCMPCVMLAPAIEELATKFKGKMLFGKINVEESNNLVGKFRIIDTPTMIFFKNGQEIKRIRGPHSEIFIEERINELLT